ncbi:eukaryotic translation initiation factor 3 subunit A-like [Impatiens glandulifera]|uniref:eukaryotic translation initiation factor 3 subunit A-like n=1 Tax=Impatiens glandulifera TaxID=253017 RepID=UPI001FB13611|nr:eukaryotic translation initiation factor 3 subunit A-like [Impatiens glandulifera]
MEPPSQTRDEEDSASSSDRTGTQNTDENPSDKEEGPNDEEQSATSLDNVGAADAGADCREEEETPIDNDQMIAANIVRQILEEIDLRAQAASAVYREWFEYRSDKFFKHMLPGLTDGQSFRRLKEIEETVIRLTNAEDPNEAMDQHAIVKSHARLQKLTVHIQKLKERYVAGTPKAKLQLLVLDMLEVKKGELIDEIEEIEAVRIQRGVTEERVKSLIQEFADSKVRPWKRKMKKAALQTIKLAETTRDELVKGDARITEIEANYRDNTPLHNDHLQRTEDLEATTSKMVDDLERFQGKTEQRLTKVDEDLGQSSTKAASTLNRVISLEEKNASLEDRNTQLEADLKALTEQEANARAAKELQDALDAQNRTEKEAPRSSNATFDERVRILTASDPEFEKTVAAREDKEAERLNNEKRRLADYAKALKKTKAASSSSVPAKRKRKTSSRQVQVTEMQERITETNIETPSNPVSQTEDEIEENLEPRSSRQRLLNTAPISTVDQPQARGSSSRPDQPNDEQPTDDMLKDFRLSDSE